MPRALGRFYPRQSDYRAVLLIDAMRWGSDSLASVFSPAFARAASLAYNYLQHRLRNAA